MEKLIYALWRPDGLSGDEFRDALVGPVAAELEAHGARGVQVNVTDGAVESAQMRISTFDAAIAATVSLWVDRCATAPRAPFEASMLAAAQRIEGWLVTESVPVAPPRVLVGERQDGLWNLAFLRRPEGLDADTWLTRWQDHHTSVAIETQGTFGYVQNLVVRPLTPATPTVSAIVEELFPMAALHDWHAHYGSGGDRQELERRMTALMASVATFGAAENLDLVPTSRYVLRSPFRD